MYQTDSIRDRAAHSFRRVYTFIVLSVTEKIYIRIRTVVDAVTYGLKFNRVEGKQKNKKKKTHTNILLLFRVTAAFSKIEYI